MPDTPFDQPFPLGEPNDALAEYFTGQSCVAALTDGPLVVNNVSFAPSCRNNWHIHQGTDGGGDQTLLCTAGSGWYQAKGSDPISMTPGTTIRVLAGTKHWHGAKADSWFSHLACVIPGTDVRNEWLEPVAEAAYAGLSSHENTE